MIRDFSGEIANQFSEDLLWNTVVAQNTIAAQ